MEVDGNVESLLSKRFDIQFWETLNRKENGYLNCSYYEIIIQSKAVDGKIKTNKSIAYPEITSIFIANKIIVLDLNTKSCQIHIQIENPLYILKCVYVVFKIFFPCEDIYQFFSVKCENQALIENLKEEINNMHFSSQSSCNNFTFGIKFYAKYAYLTENEEIIWDIDTVYANKETRNFVLKDFDHLKQKYLIPVLGTMCYNTYFTELTLSHVDLTPYEKVLERVFKFNKKFRKLKFVNCNLKLPLCSAIANGIEGQKSLICLDLSLNEGIGEKGIDLFIPFLRKTSQFLEIFKMSKCNLSSVSLSKIADSFTYNLRGEDCHIHLKVLDLSHNLLKEGFKEIFYDFLARCNQLEDLNLSGMNFSIERLPEYLLKGPVKTLKYLNLSENISSSSAQSSTQWSLFTKELISLVEVNLSNFKSLHCSVTDGLFLGLSENVSLSMMGVKVNISNSCFNGDNFNRFVSFIFNAKCVTQLDLSNNGIDAEAANIMKVLPQFPSLRSLNLNNNFLNMKPKEQQNIIRSLALVLQLENVNLQELYIANCNLGSSLSTLISELDCLFSLKILDISGNNIGNIVARTLGRMLTIDKHLREIFMDNNNVTKEIYEEILDGLETNFTLTTFHIPFVDFIKYPPKLVLPIIEKINKQHSKVNKVFQGIYFEDIKIMAFQCILNQTSENIDRCKNTLKESCNRLKSVIPTNTNLEQKIQDTLKKSFDTLKTVDKSRDLLSKLNAVYRGNDINSPLSTDLRIRKVMATVCETVSDLINDYLLEVVEGLIKEIDVTLPLVFAENSNLREELLDMCKKIMVVSNDYIKQLFERFIEHNVLKKVYEVEINATHRVQDRITDEIISRMNICDINTNNLFVMSKNSHESPKEPEISHDHLLRASKRNKVSKSTRMSTMAAPKSRPISKALKSSQKDNELDDETDRSTSPIVQELSKRLNATKLLLEASQNTPNSDCTKNDKAINDVLKNRPKPLKKTKPKTVTPNNISTDNSPTISDETWNVFHNSGVVNSEKCAEKPVKKKTSLFGLSKNKKAKPPNINFDDLGKEVSDISDVD